MSAFVRIVSEASQSWFLYPGDIIGRSDRAALRLSSLRVPEFAAAVSLRELDGLPAFFLLGLRSGLTTEAQGTTRDLAIGVHHPALPTLRIFEWFAIEEERLRVVEVNIPDARPVLRLPGADVLLPMSDAGLSLASPFLLPSDEGVAQLRFDRVGWSVEEGGVRTWSLTEDDSVVKIAGISVPLIWQTAAAASPTASFPAPVVVVVRPDRIEVSHGGARRLWDASSSERELFEVVLGLLKSAPTASVREVVQRLNPGFKTVTEANIGSMQRGTWHRAMSGFPFRRPMRWCNEAIQLEHGVVIDDRR